MAKGHGGVSLTCLGGLIYDLVVRALDVDREGTNVLKGQKRVKRALPPSMVRELGETDLVERELELRHSRRMVGREGEEGEMHPTYLLSNLATLPAGSKRFPNDSEDEHFITVRDQSSFACCHPHQSFGKSAPEQVGTMAGARANAVRVVFSSGARAFMCLGARQGSKRPSAAQGGRGLRVGGTYWDLSGMGN